MGAHIQRICSDRGMKRGDRVVETVEMLQGDRAIRMQPA